MFLAGYLAATAYLIFRDDLIGAAAARNARLMHEYEDRIAALRANLDRVTSRQLLDQQAIESKIAELLEREEILRNRSGRIGGLVDRARRDGLVGEPAPATEARDPIATGAVPPPQAATPFAGSPLFASAMDLRGTREKAEPEPGMPDIADIAATETMFAQVAGRIDAIDAGQRAMIDEIRTAAGRRAAGIAAIMRKLDIPVPESMPGAVGGPFIPAEISLPFAAQIDALDESLAALDAMSARLSAVPLGNPAPATQVSSAFGTRIDPFLGRPAMHSGIDFRAAEGTEVKATADGTVIDAGRNGGYGNMVEIEHENGLTTRYAHLGRILVKEGDRVLRGATIGLSGTTGRSTGPHLHYEVHRAGGAVDPARFLKAGRELAKLP